MRKVTMFAAGFAVMLIAGIATAQIGSLMEDTTPATSEIEELEAAEVVETTTTTKPAEEPAEEPVEEEKPEPEEKPVVEEPVDDSTFIEILHPAPNQVFEKKEVVFEGVTEPGAKVFAGAYEADVNAEGEWRIVLWLSPGSNVATLHAIDAAGNKATDTVKVLLELPAEEEKPKADEPKGEEEKPKTEEEKPRAEEEKPEKDASDMAFSAHQKWGSCEESPPYDIFYGTGRTGLVVEIWSHYGSARREVGESGRWDAKVVFEGAPVGEPIDVVIETSDGDRKVFSFVRLGSEKD